ncbi:HNH endonuclease signature motif containing protein [Pseudonocardia adelaidensis]|uniref:HNH nuclease domain-containing protein n=1 Tax=Pseudonocardia adelaidensis TaxID=648754 RepID=A0ABP9NVU8_9PSEU
MREGVELRVGLATLLGGDQRPGEIPGLGPVDAEIARAAAARQRRGARWQFAIVDPRGYLLLAGPLRRRPRTTTSPRGSGRVRGGVVELHLTLEELSRLAADPALTGGWTGVIAEVAQRWAERHRLWRELGKNPHTRYARGALARHVQVRDRSCVGPGCERSARRSQMDHTVDHARGGPSVETNIGPGCWRHHPDKDRGWRLSQPEPGHFVRVSPLGRVYRTRGEPVRPDLPDPDPPPPGTDPRADPDTDTGRPVDLRILWRQARDPARPPPPPPDDEEEPPF